MPELTFAQKKLQETFDAKNLKQLIIESDEIFAIEITTAPMQEVIISTKIEGESSTQTILHTNINRDRLEITTGKTADYIAIDDKLAAHKVLSVVLRITIPEGMDLVVSSTLAQLSVVGIIGNLQAVLGRGDCLVEALGFRESININTISGSIHIKTPPANLVANSRNGDVLLPEEIGGFRNISLGSVHGNIVVEKQL